MDLNLDLVLNLPYYRTHGAATNLSLNLDLDLDLPERSEVRQLTD